MRWGLAGLSRARDNIQNQLSELAKQKPRNKEDDNLTSEMMRLESVLQVARDDLVRICVLLSKTCPFLSHALQSACNHKLRGIKDELKHIDRSLKQNAPEYNKVLFCRIPACGVA
jgi:structural maintenance of chromosome 1